MAEASFRIGVFARPFLLPTCVLLLLVSACARLPTGPEPSVEDTAPLSRVAIIISDSLPAYEGVAAILAQRLSPSPQVYRLDGRVDNLRALLPVLKAQGSAPIVAIGPEAVEAAAMIPARPTVFCQVYRYDTVGGVRHGVKAIPPAAKQLQAWKLVDPRLQRVALVTGPGHRELANEARSAAKQERLEIQHVEVRSDKELLYAVKRLDASIQGLWLAPDRRVLSSEVLREALSHSVRQGKSVLAFSPQLLPYGALLSVEGEHDDVAERVMAQIRQLENGARREGVAALTRARVEVNPLVAAHLGLTVPPALQGGVHVF